MAQSPDRDEMQSAVAAAREIVADRLRSIVDRIERVELERKNLGVDIKEVYAEAKSAGYDLKALRQLIRERRQDAAEREEIESLVEVYRRALGDYQSTPLGDAAIRRVA